MICLEKADNFTRELAQLMEKYGLHITVDDGYSELSIDSIPPDRIPIYIDDLLCNTPRK